MIRGEMVVLLAVAVGGCRAAATSRPPMRGTTMPPPAMACWQVTLARGTPASTGPLPRRPTWSP
ncbi:MAG: hypothetical protein IPG96_12610 [Proteobacteria bacterium]|nr:hypothetical protein [Pseudomonadota bacterium]